MADRQKYAWTLTNALNGSPTNAPAAFAATK
jgi:hypothetical protein